MRVNLSNLQTVNRHYYTIFKKCTVLLVVLLVGIIIAVGLAVALFLHATRPDASNSKRPVFREEVLAAPSTSMRMPVARVSGW